MDDKKKAGKAPPDVPVPESLYNHLVLPPFQVPHQQEQDHKIREIEDELVDRLIDSARHIRDLPGADVEEHPGTQNVFRSTWESVHRSLRATKAVNGGGRIDRDTLAQELCSLSETDFLIINVRAQNCGIFIRRAIDSVLGSSVIFEAFESSARNEDILATENALQWNFPGCAVAVPFSTFLEDGFISNLASFLEHASRETVTDFAAHTFKAGATIFEYRNTAEPGLITSMLMAILQENGRRIAPKLLQKMIRDDVCWKNANKPWRRLPWWLILRVSIARFLAFQLGGEVGRADYKFCLVHLMTNFLADVKGTSMTVERLDYLKKKICRRLAKLDFDNERAQDPEAAARIDYLFLQFEAGIARTVSQVSAIINASWNQQKLLMAKSIPLLPRQATGEDLRLDLRVSHSYLMDVLNGYSRPRRLDDRQINSVSIAKATKMHLNSFARRHFQLVDLDIECRQFVTQAAPMLSDSEVCASASQLISRLIQAISSLPDYIPEVKSSFILDVMEIWVKMDQAACNLYPLMTEYHPMLYPDMLDVLLIPRHRDMKRLLAVQLYLENRIAACGRSKISIFGDPNVRGCFGQRAYDEFPDSHRFENLHEAVETWAKNQRLAKEKEWKEKSARYSFLSRQVDQSSCVYLVDEENPLGRGRHDPRCHHCKMVRDLESMRILVYEHPLPSDIVVAKAVIFELACPASFAIYRDATWRLISKLSFPSQEESKQPRCVIRKYEQLEMFANSTTSSFSLASTTKSFLATHYSRLSFPVEWESDKNGVCRPNGLKLACFDVDSSLWSGRRRCRLSFAHHVKLNIPKSSPFSKVLQQPAFSENIYGCSSYEVMASVSTCPSGINVHEYLAFQTIASGKSRRWFSILTELASANLNFSNEATMLLVRHLTHQCGPLGQSKDSFRLIHETFRDESFCEKLIFQLSHRLVSLSANWRETNLMEMIISIALRLFDMTTAAKHVHASGHALSLLSHARQICVRWFTLLRAETYQTTDSDTAQRYQQYALWAALLCKQTFAHCIDHALDFDDTLLSTFILSSVVAQENLVAKVESLPILLQHAVVRDLRMSYSIRDSISKSIESNPSVFKAALEEVWPTEEGCSRTLSKLVSENAEWISCVATGGEGTYEQHVFYNFVEGIFLIDGRPIGKLPKDPTKSFVLSELFGNRTLLTYPSEANGMQYRLCVRPQGYTVHVGFGKDGNMIVRAYRPGYTLQLIDREKFRTTTAWDLPGPLLEGHFHWLNLSTGQVYITKHERPWPCDKFPGFILDVYRRTCTRSRVYNGQRTSDSVVNTYSALFNRATRILDSFEPKRYVLVLQPAGRCVQIELPRLNILFHVNNKYLLQSPQLRCEIDPDQDIGTWYGLRSKLVCRNVDNPTHRIVLVPLGKFVVDAHGCHVTLRVEPNGSYARYTINTTLGKIECAAEPVLAYTKALIHAYTSFIIPDPLTNRTGREEAVQWLESGICQPWEPLGPTALQRLIAIAMLTPKRIYYPNDLKVMRMDQWTEAIPITLQSSVFRPIIDRILETSKNLTRFALSDHEIPDLPEFGDPHLHKRVILRQQALERHSNNDIGELVPENRVYQSRDRPSSTNIGHSNVLEITNLIRKWPQNFTTTVHLAQDLATGRVIGGDQGAYNKVSLENRLNVDIIANWGSLVRFAQQTKNRYSLMFLFGLMSFRLNANLPLVRALAAFAIFEDLQTIELPPWEEYTHFQANQVPQLPYLFHLLKPFGSPPPEDDRTILEEFASTKQRRKLQMERSKYEARVEDDIKLFAKFLLDQWPCSEPSASQLSQSVLLEVGPALETIRPEWKRLYQNMDLTKHIEKVQKILDSRSKEDRFDPVRVVHSEDTFSIRIRGRELVDLGQLLGKPLDIERHSKDETTANVGIARVIEPALHGPNSALRTLPMTQWSSSMKVSTGTNRVLATQQSNYKHAKRGPSDHEHDQAIMQLGEMTKCLQASRSEVKRQYAAVLYQSLDAFRKSSSTKAISRGMIRRDLPIKRSTNEVDKIFQRLLASLGAPSPGCSGRRIEWLKAGNLWPDTSKTAILRQLRSTSTQRTYGSGIHKTLVQLGVEITQLQREIRLHDLALKKDPGRYQEEEANQGHTNWDPIERPDWLLLEIESNMMIRPVQIDVALATMAPKSGSNSVLQMNMGQGKTSCIIPMVAAALADTNRLVRIVVPKALLQQTAQLLQTRLGGMLNRQLRHVPFFRRTPTTEDNIKAFYSIHNQMLKSAGIMICQPEHNMSFTLSGRQRLLDNQIGQAGPMIKLHSWLSRVSRDVLDESDYTLAVRTQLIYPSGSQMTVDGHPHRWQVVEAILRLVDEHMYSLPASFPNSLGVIRRVGGGFPFMFFLRQDVENELIRRLTSDICQGFGGILPMTTNALTTAERVAIKDFLTASNPNTKSIERIRKICPDRPSVRQAIYLLRGLLVNRILMMTLKKRWNVEYGLHPQRDPIAVPFHAKGVPSEQSEWGHPDVAILFTCLAFYYDGVNLAQLRQCLEHILKSDDPAAEYDKWSQSTEDFPPSLRAWNSINVDDDMQLNDIWKAVRYARVVIDYFLNNFVFPRHAKQFKAKLQSNGWDIPLFQLTDTADLDKKSTTRPMTTGFSGTNDNRTMLPLNIEQQDLPSLLHTSAEVLTYLLHSRNRQCVLFSELQESRLGRATEIDLLYGLKKKSIRVLIDAGAQILEMDNLTLVEQWLRIDNKALAALYFDQGNKPWILTKQGSRTPLVASPFADDLSQCLVYLDEAHTRGTDLKLPPSSRGALTLRLGQTKDHTVQAAMRLRQLGTTQAVTFFIPPEVHQSIADLHGKSMHEIIDSADVVEWLLDNTCEAIEQLQPLYYAQGIDFCRRMQAELDNPDFLTNKSQRELFIEQIKQDEQQTLQQLYEPKFKNRATGFQRPTNEKLKHFTKELNTRRKAFQDTGRAVHASALQEVEQEREVAFEVESVRQVKKPHQYAANSFPGLHPNLESFARTGRIPADAHYFCHILHSICKTGVGRKFKVRRGISDSKIFVTAEFDQTVKLSVDLTMDSFIRPVNWVLWSPTTETAIIVIPEEAEALIPMMRDRNSDFATYLLCYSAPITRKMLGFNDLDFCSIPALPCDWKAPTWLRTELGLFAGRLYFDWNEYEPLCQFLGIEEGILEEGESGALDSLDGAADDDNAEDNSKTSERNQLDNKFVDKPMTFIQEWLAIRRRGQDFVHSPMGFVSQGRMLSSDHVFFAQSLNELQESDHLVIASLSHRSNAEGENYDEHYHGVDDMGANQGLVEEAGDDRFVYDDLEQEVHSDQGFGSDSG